MFKNIRNYLPEIGMINTALIVVAFIVEIITLSGASEYGQLTIIDAFLKDINIIVAFFYTFSGYKKDAAKYYKAYMILMIVVFVYTFGCNIYFTNVSETQSGNYITSVMDAITIIGFVILSFVKDFGKKNSCITIFTILVAQIIAFIRYFTIYRVSGNYGMVCLLNLLLVCIAVVFVLAKYADKDNRGTK